MDALPQICGIFGDAPSVVALTGAGVSTASGIPDYRSPGEGLWATVDPMEVASLDAFRRNPARFWRFYRERLASLSDKDPNPAHEALAALEGLGRLRGVVTQNIDRLHRRAGSRNVVEVHGSIDRAVCLACGTAYPADELRRRLEHAEIPSCDCGGPLKPGVVLFGEELPEGAMDRAQRWVDEADLLLIIGSSLEVWPAAGLPATVLASGGRLVIVNATPTGYDDRADAVVREPAESFLPRLVDALVAGGCGRGGGSSA